MAVTPQYRQNAFQAAETAWSAPCARHLTTANMPPLEDPEAGLSDHDAFNETTA